MTECKTPRCILEEAASFLDTDISSIDNDYLDGTSDTGWVKGNEVAWANTIGEFGDGHQVGEAKGVCSIGAIALASLDSFQLGTVIPVKSYASFGVVARSNDSVALAGWHLYKAIHSEPNFRTRMGPVHDELIHAWPLEALERVLRYKVTATHICKEPAAGFVECSFDFGECTKDTVISYIAEGIAEFNDHDDTTWEEVTQVFKTAIKFAIDDEEKVE